MNTSFALSTLIGLVAASVAAQDYAIKMHQPLKVGQRYKYTAMASESSEKSMTSEQRVVNNQKEELSLEMESEATVLTVDAQGRPTKESHTILKLLEGAGKKPMLPAGTKVIASQGPFTFADTSMTITFTGAFPADYTKSVREEGATMTVLLKASGKPNPDGPVVEMSGKAKRSATRQYKLLE